MTHVKEGRAKKVRVVVTDIETGDTSSAEIEDDYIIICAGTCDVSYFQVCKNGTHQLTVKGRKVDGR